MAFYNGYPFQPIYQPVQAQAVQNPQQSQQGGIIWVQGEAAAKSYLVAPGSTVPLWDSERQTIYIKSADAAGMPSMKVIDYTIREPQAQQAQAAPDYATREDLDAVRAQLAALQDELKKARETDE
jgi:hypothetical protein